MAPPKHISKQCELPIPPVPFSLGTDSDGYKAPAITLGDGAKAGSILEATARRLQGRHKSKAIVLGNLALAHVRQRDVEQAATVLHRAIDLLEVSRGGGGLNVVSTAVRELQP